MTKRIKIDENWIENLSLENNLSDLMNNLIKNNNNAILISGYRGTGKTHLIKKLEEEDKIPCNYLFVYQNLNKFDSYSNITRSIIRNIRNEVISKNIVISKNLKENLENLYDHTFYEIRNTDIKESINLISLKFHTQQIVFYTLIFLSIIINNLDFTWIAFIVIILWEVITLSFNITHKKKKELIRNSLYDEEIAEYKLKELITNLKKENCNIVLVFDEVDKIENDEELTIILSEFKHLILSEDLDVIFIAGQKLLYRYINSKYIDDGLEHNVFTHTVHVPLLKISSLREIIKHSLKCDDKNLQNELILKSKGTIRNLINEINSKTIYEKQNAYLNFEDNNKKIKLNEKILYTIQHIEENNLSIEENKGENDLIRYNIYLWINRLFRFNTKRFHLDDILSDDDYKYLYNIKYKVENIFYIFINELLEKKVINKILEEEDTKEEYELNANYISKEILLEELNNEFLGEFIDFEKLIRNIYKSISKNQKNTWNISRMYKYNFDKLLINSKFENINSIKEWRNNIVHGVTISKNEKELKEIIQKLKKLKIEIIEKYFNYLLEEMNNNRYKITHGNIAFSHDFVIEFNDTRLKKFIDLKYIHKINNYKVKNHIYNTKLNQKTDSLYLFIYANNSSINEIDNSKTYKNIIYFNSDNIIKIRYYLMEILELDK